MNKIMNKKFQKEMWLKENELEGYSNNHREIMGKNKKDVEYKTGCKVESVITKATKKEMGVYLLEDLD
ncbi:MAG TPA: hypothetical protein VJ895_01280 [Candidatus Nanoarchaeia archaeon]|nr:hypothetical protein [Candidatus Nanoarchaeia archaeon]